MLDARTILLICTATAGWAFSFGLGSQVVSHWLKAAGASDTVVGLCHSFYYFGLAIGSCAVPRLTRWLGAKHCSLAGMLLAGITLAIFPWSDGEASWHVLRFANGWAGAMSLVPLETIVSLESASERKTQNFAYYGVALTLGGALGIGIGPSFFQPGDPFAFYLGGGTSVLAAAMLFALAARSPAASHADAVDSLDWKRNFLSYGTAWCQGFLEGGMLAFLSLFLLSRGYNESSAGALMGATMVGVIAFQVPVSALADRYGKTPILLGCYAIVALGLSAVPWVTNGLALATVLFCFGACTGAMYPLGLSLLSDHVPANALARAYAWYLAIECIGSQLGAAAMGWGRDQWGEGSMFAIGLVAVVGVMASWLGLRRSLAGPPAAILQPEVPGQRAA